MSVNLGEQKITDIIKTEAGSGGTGDYNELTNKPQINGVTLVGNLTTEDLNIDISSVDAYTKSETDEKISSAVSTKADTSYVNEQLNLKVDKSLLSTSLATKADVTSVYTKEETDSAISSAITGKADVTYVDNGLESKADKSTTYNKTEIDTAINNLSSNITGKLANKADINSVYTKDEMPSVIAANITNKADQSYVDSQLANKADKATTYTKNEVDNLLDNPTITGDTLPIGSMILYNGLTIPQNWLLCDGREVSREIYSELFAVIGTIWGSGDGATSFNLPNYLDKFPLGAGGNTDLAETGGEKEHNHAENVFAYNGKLAVSNTDIAAKISKSMIYTVDGTTGFTSVSGIQKCDTYRTEKSSNMPPYVGSYYIIKAKQSAGVIATVVDTLESTSATDALSANMGKKLKDLITPVVLFSGDVSVSSPVTLSDNFKNYSYIEVYAVVGGGANILAPVVKVLKEFNNFQIVFNSSPSTGWINMNIDFSISENKITATALRQAYINNNKVVERVTTDLASYGWNLHIVKVLGYK